jgi:hypothetical protein
MKLVRVSTTDPKAQFDNTFDSGIGIPENSAIALQNLSIELDEEEIVIDSTNDTIRYQFTTLTLLTAIIRHGTYQKSNIGNGVAGVDLLYEIRKALNLSLTTSKNQIGTEYNVYINNDKRVAIEWRTNPSKDPGRTDLPGYPLATTAKVTRTGTQANGVYGRSDTGTDRTSYLYVDRFASRGAALWMAEISTKPNAGEFIFGFTTSNPKNITSFTDNVFEYAIVAFGAGTNYDIIKSGTRSVPGTTKALAAGDTMAVNISGGNVLLNIYDSAGAETNMESYVYDNNVKLYPVIVFAATSGNKVTTLRFTSSPYQDNTEYLFINNDNPNLTTGDIPEQGTVQNKEQFMIFGSATLANWLGYNNTRHPGSGTVLVKNTNTFNADTLVSVIDLGQNLIVELLSFDIDSHDGYDGKRRNIVATIPVESNNGAVQFSPPYPLFIDLQNSTPLVIRNLRLRILKRDLSPVEINGIATMCLLFKS